MNHNCYLIAEVGQAHEGSLGLAHSLIDSVSKTGVDAVKFQMHIAEAESSEFEEFRVKFSYEDKTRFEYWKRMEFTIEQWIGIKKHCEDVGLDFICSPFSMRAVDILESMGVCAYKIGSGEARNKLMLTRIAKINKPIFISNGLSSDDEISETISWINPYNTNITLFQCTTKYPTEPKDWGLNKIKYLKDKYNLPVGYSDHSGDIFSCIAACVLNAEFLEFHVTYDKEMFGPDSSSSLTITQVKELVKGVRSILMSKNSDIEENLSRDNLKIIFGKSLSVNKNMKQGQEIGFFDLETKKPSGKGIDSIFYEQVLGKRIKRDLNKGDFINFEDLN